MTAYAQVVTYPRVTLHSEPAFDLAVNYQQPQPGTLMTFVHLEVYQTAPSVMRSMQAMWSTVRPTLGPIVFCHGEIDDHKFHKFVTRFGWQHLSHTNCSDGKTRRIYVHYLRNADGSRSE